MSSRFVIPTVVSGAIARRLHRLTRIGVRTVVRSRTPGGTYLGILLMGLGWFLKSSGRRTLLYGVNVPKGGAITVAVLDGTTKRAETTVAN